MKVIYIKIQTADDVFIGGSQGNQRLLVWFEDNLDWYVYYCCDLTSQTYINRIINKMLTRDLLFSLDNFERIEDDEQFKKYSEWVNNKVNFAGLHKDVAMDT